MRLLLDTHILLWMLVGSERVGQEARSLIDDPAHEPLASVISIWEVAIKWSLRRGAAGDMPLSGADFAAALNEAGITVLPTEPRHVVALEKLPMLHGDPFDRLLVATARSERLTLLTRDTILAEYGKNVQLV